ncbi:MAG: Flp pilus assembly protein CpaB [Bryobacteraceae bacterium]|jgi:pilus assembly protein CpaB
MKRNMVPLLGIAFVVAIISTGIFYGLFAGKLRSSSDILGHSVVVAGRDLERGTVLQASDLRISEAPGILTGSFSKLDEAVGATLLTPLKTNEPLLAERVVSRASPGGASGSGIVPSGMRAVSIRVSESDGLLSRLRPGARVDLQAISERENNQVELRNILQNVEVLAVSPQDPASSRSADATVTVLTHAQDADAVALSDAGGKIRVTLRNPFDDGVTAPHAMALASIYSNQTNPAALAAQLLSAQISPAERSPAASVPAASTASATNSQAGSGDGWDHPIQLHVQVLNVTEPAFEQLRSRLGSGPGGGSPDADWRVGSFPSGEDGAKLIQSLQRKHELEVVSSERLMAGVGRPISYRAGAAPYHLRVQFSPELASGGALSLRVKPEISAPSGSGVATSKYDAGLPANSSFLVESSSTDDAPDRLFPGRTWEQRHLVIFVTAFAIQRSPAIALAHTGRGR